MRTTQSNIIKKPVTQQEKNQAYRRLAMAILEQVVDDIRHLVRNGAIVDGEVVNLWAQKSYDKHKNGIRISNHYNKYFKALELLEFINGGACEALLMMLDYPVELDSIKSVMYERQPRNKPARQRL